jgi:hypothetical protein
MTRTAIIREIYIKLDEILPPGEGMSHPFDSYINSVLDDSYRQILTECPVSLLNMSEIDPDEVAYDEDKAYIPVPDNFVRVGLFKFEDWINPARANITVDSPMYKMLETGILPGSVIKPVILLTHAKIGDDATPKRYLVAYYVPTEDSAEYLYYIEYNKDTGLESLNDQVIPGLTWLAASKMMQILELPGLKIADERYRQFIQLNAI